MMGINIRKFEKLPSKIILPYNDLNGLSSFPYRRIAYLMFMRNNQDSLIIYSLIPVMSVLDFG